MPSTMYDVFIKVLSAYQASYLTDQDREVVNCTRSRAKIKSKLTNLMKISRIEGYNDKYGSNPQGIRGISNDLFEFNQIGQ